MTAHSGEWPAAPVFSQRATLPKSIEALPCPSSSKRHALVSRKTGGIRGTYLGVRVDQTTGAPDKKIAAKVLAKVRDEIEGGAFSRPGAPTFAGAALKYVEAGGEERFVLRLAEHFGETPLTRIDQAAVDAAALALYPRATPATRNRQVYSPVSAILKVAGVADGLKRPKGARGARRLFWLTPEQASALLTAAEARDADSGYFSSCFTPVAGSPRRFAPDRGR